jgi:hypothetical protein
MTGDATRAEQVASRRFPQTRDKEKPGAMAIACTAAAVPFAAMTPRKTRRARFR